jgi:hypothetical protein
MRMTKHYKLFHVVLRALVAVTAVLLVLGTLFDPFYRLLIRMGLDGYVGVWILLSPLVVGPAWLLEFLVMQKDLGERKALVIDTVVCGVWCFICVVLWTQGLSHLPML